MNRVNHMHRNLLIRVMQYNPFQTSFRRVDEKSPMIVEENDRKIFSFKKNSLKSHIAKSDE